MPGTEIGPSHNAALNAGRTMAPKAPPKCIMPAGFQNTTEHPCRECSGFCSACSPVASCEIAASDLETALDV